MNLSSWFRVFIGCIFVFQSISCRTSSSNQDGVEVSQTASATTPISQVEQQNVEVRWQASYKWGFGQPIVELRQLNPLDGPTNTNPVIQLAECGTGPIIRCSKDRYRIEIRPAMRKAVLTEGDRILAQMVCNSDKANDIASNPYICISP